MARARKSQFQWLLVIGGPILSLISFVVAYFVDPLHFAKRGALAALPAFLLAVVVLLINHNLAAYRELESASEHSDRIYEAVKDYLHVTKIGAPEAAFRYVVGRLPIVQEVRNTSFNVVEEVDRSDEKLYETDSYLETIRELAVWTARGLRWKDIGDIRSVPRFRYAMQAATTSANRNPTRYQYRIIGNEEPQINFILLDYPDGTSEVLFNWDFRSIGQDPTVLLSRDRDIVSMFSTQFEYLWRAAATDHDDNTATRSTSKK
jgi:hypothetical protein